MQLLRYSFSIGRFVFAFSVIRADKQGVKRKPDTHLNLSRKLKFLRGHALKRHPNYGGAREISKRYKYYKERQYRMPAGSSRPQNKSPRRSVSAGSQRRYKNHAPPQFPRKQSLSVR